MMNTTAYERIVQAVRQHGERMTIQRQMVIEALTATGEHLSIQDVSAYLREHYPATPLAEPTIYRILQKLKALGVVSQTDMAEMGIVYQIIDAPRHHHLICLHCGATTDVPDSLFDALRSRLNDGYGFRARIDHMAIYGLCAKCAAEADSR